MHPIGFGITAEEIFPDTATQEGFLLVETALVFTRLHQLGIGICRFSRQRSLVHFDV